MHISGVDPASHSATTRVTVTIRPFARYAEVLGHERITAELVAPANVGDVVALLRDRVANGQSLPAHPLVAINLEQVSAGFQVQDGDELSLLPPLAGG